MKQLLVKDWMQSEVITARGKMAMLDAHKLMRDRNIRRLPVVKKDGTLVGIVTRSDIRRAEPSNATSLSVWEINYLLSKLTLKEIMTRQVVTIGPEESIKAAAERMLEHRIGALPVVDDAGKVVGIITESDIFRILVQWYNEQMSAEEAAS